MFELHFGAQSLVYVAGAFYVMGLITINQVILRLLVLTGTCIYLLYYFNIADEPLWSAIYISCLIGLANLFGLLSLLARRSRFAIPKAHADIYPLMSLLPPGDFRTLMKLANRHHIKDRKQVTYEGKPGHTLYFVISGVPEVEKGDAKFTMAPHKFIGEIAFLIDGISSASVWLPEGTEVLEWKFSDLRQYGEKSPRFKLALDAAISIDLAHKVAAGIALPTAEPRKCNENGTDHSVPPSLSSP